MLKGFKKYYSDNMNTTKRILVIDDEPSALDLLRRILEGEGYEVQTATNGQEGVKLFRQQPFDLVVTDMVMPVQDGLQTIFELRNDAPNIPVIAISGGGTISKERYLTVVGYLDKITTIAKPFTIEAIANAAAQIFQNQDQKPTTDT